MNIEQIQQHIIDTQQIQIVGKASQVQVIHDNVLDMSLYAGLVDYHPEELVITIKAGTSIKEIENMLSTQGQTLAFSIQGNDNASIGGAYAMGSPDLRDAVLGVKIIDGQGRLLTFGGQVMKNVAGYDVSRLLVGSKGKLAVICEISFRVIPKAYANQSDKQNATARAQSSSVVRTYIEQGLKNIFDPHKKFI
jgi:glycolate dehydrogenase FAD-binding subunit